MSDYQPPHIIKPAFAAAAAKKSSFQGLLEFLDTRSFRRILGVLSVGSAAVVAYFLYKRSIAARLETVDKLMEKEKAEASQLPMEQIEEIEKKVILYQVPRGFFTPAVAPFGLKLETFMRVAKIPYEVHVNTSKQEVGTPWIKVGDRELRDNHECIRYLSKEFNINLSDMAPNSRKTASYLVDAVLDSKIYWAIALWRWVYDEGKTLKDIQPLTPTGEAVLEDIKESVLKSAKYNNIGRLPQEEVISTAIQDLNHLSAALGKHPYFLGEEPGEVDCNAFSILAQMVWNMPGSPFEQAIKKQKSLMDFVIRIREKFWPDWDDLIQQPLESKVTSQISLIDPAINEGQDSKSSDIAAKSNLSLATPVSATPASTPKTADTNANTEKSSLSNPKDNTTSKSVGSIPYHEPERIKEKTQPLSLNSNAPVVDNHHQSAESKNSTFPKESAPKPEKVPVQPTTPYISTPKLGAILNNSNKIPQHSLPGQTFQQRVLDTQQPISIRDIVNNSNNSSRPSYQVKLAQEQANQIQNTHMQHHQATLEKEGQNKFQHFSTNVSGMNTQTTTGLRPTTPQSEHFKFNRSAEPHQPAPYNNQPEFMKGLEQAAHAAMLHVGPSYRAPVGQDQQYYRMSEQDKRFNPSQGYQFDSQAGTDQRNNAQVSQPDSNHTYARYWQ